MHRVGGADPERIGTRERKPREEVVLAIIRREFDTVIIGATLRDGQEQCEHAGAELGANALVEHAARPAIANAVAHDIVQNARDHRVFVAPIAGENDRDVRGMREIREPRALADLLIVVLCREGEGVVDPIGVAGHRRGD